MAELSVTIASANVEPKVRFAVVSWAPVGSTMAVVGNDAKIGSWDPSKGLVMKCSLGSQRFESEPDYWSVETEMTLEELGKVEFKFVRKDPNESTWQWDDGENRKVKTTECSGLSTILLPVVRFRDGSGAESDLTGRFYSTVKERREMSVRVVSDNIILGSCPRRPEHLDLLKSLGVTVVMNFQAETDAMKNCVEGIGMEENALAISPLYDKVGIKYVWMPTEDMSSAARAAMLPQAAYVMAGVLRQGHKIYVHCNAGVGRSVAAVCGYLYYCVGMAPRQVEHVVARSRTVAYFDFPALDVAKARYEGLFGGPSPSLNEEKVRLLTAAGLPVE
eukprot:CAMPEP_0206584216 /NCGR_PEP_ID=MMETSP0325_2-20121206/35582_1 /ASSEMBLY_ACC=CAM_ASM_000347 /TAXON_ID=2866 /ORGANISM="Crypthecodinium cohnii, Strain Seligo" /LENGTH=332 /DNA_ID=CAMNT_0054091315 /DNA_START=34 /DNA_END=1032 /DNA_ORIENTATION=-